MMEKKTGSFDIDAAKALFRRMLDALTEANLAVMVISFWVWLETRKGCTGFIEGISNLAQEKMELAVKEAELVLSILNGKEVAKEEKEILGAMEVTQGLLPKFISWSAIFCFKKCVTSEIKVVCDNLTKSGLFGNVVPNASSSSSKSNLNPNAKAWDPVTDRASEAQRSLFLTFSNGYPLNERQITYFFNANFGTCVEKVYVHWPEIRNANFRMPPLFGKVVFKASHYPPIILAGQNEIRFMVNHKALWCKRFDPRRRFR